MTADRWQALDDAVARDVAAGRIPGAVMRVQHAGDVVHQRAIGQRDPASGAAMTEDTIFRIYSMTKPIVSVATMMLVEAGRLGLDDAVALHLPEFGSLQVATETVDGDGRKTLALMPCPRPPTVRDLLRHTAGFTYGIFGQSLLKSRYLQAGVESRQASNTEFAHRLARLPLAYAPGTVWEYSRATDLLGALIERITGQTLGEHLAQQIFQPLGMVDTGFHVPAAEQHRLAQPFAADPETGQPIRLLDATQPPVLESGGGGLVSTAADYLRFARLLLAGGELDGTRLLRADTIALMTQDQLGAEIIRASQVPGATTEYLPGPGYGFGLGFAVRLADAGARYPGHAGDYHWAGLGGTSFWIDPQAQLIAIWMMQAPSLREAYQAFFRSAVYAAL
ncbi:serine hydrolase domain-containing protein [Ideonella sp. BN130291]|uniref:serine hydrolase domain-containing protein n=1 Tax=Ideonella sp. BN130291 TaxID=3112940 RepID=UPI002E26B6F0|nr:serine hydrolase domain-containing protein [Ideonella sp. BN130291]